MNLMALVLVVLKIKCSPLIFLNCLDHCGKLICCLKYEDDYYSEAKKDFPRINARFTNDNQKPTTKLNHSMSLIGPFNLSGKNEYLTVPLDEFNQKVDPVQ